MSWPTWELFHFIRPEVLWALPGLLLLHVFMRLFRDSRSGWQGVIAPHLIRAFTVGESRCRWLRPVNVLGVVWILGVLAVAGPTWEREPTPFAEDTAPLVIALDLGASMNAIDVQPTRLERARHKVLDLLEHRPGSRTALIAYAGTAHVILPLTDDSEAIRIYLESLSTDLMPRPGRAPDRALSLARELLDADPTPGSVLFISDHPPAPIDPFAEFLAEGDDALLFLGLGTEQGGAMKRGENRFEPDATGVTPVDRRAFEDRVARIGASSVWASVDDRDVARLQRRVQTHLQQVQNDDQRWKDFGYFLTFPIAALVLLWFRRGFWVEWAVMVVLLVHGPLACTGDSAVEHVLLTPDQRGRLAYERGDLEAALDRFEDPMWLGIVATRLGEHAPAVGHFARVGTAEARVWQGNALAHQGLLESALQSYDRALERDPGMESARENRERLATLKAELDAANKQPDEGPPEGGDTGGQLEADGYDEVEGMLGGTEIEVTGKLPGLSDTQIEEMWMRRLPTTPRDFLKLKMRYQAAKERGQ